MAEYPALRSARCCEGLSIQTSQRNACKLCRHTQFLSLTCDPYSLPLHLLIVCASNRLCYCWGEITNNPLFVQFSSFFFPKQLQHCALYYHTVESSILVYRGLQTSCFHQRADTFTLFELCDFFFFFFCKTLSIFCHCKHADLLGPVQ